MTRATTRSSSIRRRRSRIRTRLCASSHATTGYLSLLLAVSTRNQQVRDLVVREMVIDTLAAPSGNDLSWPATD